MKTTLQDKEKSGAGVQGDIMQTFDKMRYMVGNTPMIRLDYRYKGSPGSVYVKCENFNLTGSVKDRMALHILEHAYRNGLIRPQDRIVEATSGNTGISFAAIGRALGHRVTIIMPDWLSAERFDIIKSYGAEIIRVSADQGGFLGSIALSQQMASLDDNIFLPRQFENRMNAAAHECSTAVEIVSQLRSLSLTPDAFVAGVGTGGTVMGVGGHLKEVFPLVKVHPLEPLESPTLSTGFKVGKHRIQGISDEFIPAIMDLSRLDRVVQASDGDSILMAQQLASVLGLGVGISSGANLLGAIKLQAELGEGSVVVTVFSDSNKKYLSTDLMRIETVKQHYVSSHVELLRYEPIERCREC